MLSKIGASFFVITCVVLAGCVGSTFANRTIEEDLLFVASEDIMSEANALVEFLDRKSVSYARIEFDELSAYNGSVKHIVVFLGMDNREMAEVASEVLSPEDFEWLKEEDSNSIFVSEDVWNSEQWVMVFGGENMPLAVDGLDYFRDQWVAQIAGWFNLPLTSKELYSY